MTCYYKVDGIVRRGTYSSGGYCIGISQSRIESIEPSEPQGEWKRCIAVPGLIQTHVHLGQTLFRGMAENRRLISWLQDRIWPLEAAHTPDTLAVSVIMSLRELFSSGCTGLLDMGVTRNSDVIVDLLLRSGARALTGNCLMDTGPDYIREDTVWLMEEADRIRALCRDNVGYVYTPRFALSCSHRIWKWMEELPRGVKRTTHASESPDELDHPDIAGCGGNIKYLHERGFLTPDTLLAHCIHLQPGEAGLLSRTDTTAVHCPWTNLRLGSGIADVPALAEHGVNVTVASDGAACNNRLDAAGDLRLAMGLSSIKDAPGSLPSDYWLGSLTRSAADALGWPDTGDLTPGMLADIVLLEPSEEEFRELRLAQDPLRYILELPWSERTVLTVVDGRTVFKRGEFPTLPSLPMSLETAREAVWDRAGDLAPGEADR